MEARAAAASEEVSQRVANVTQYIGTRAAEASNALAERVLHAPPRTSRRAPLRPPSSWPHRIGAIAGDIEVKSRTAADLLQARAADIAGSLKVNTSDASRMLIELSGSTAEALRAAVLRRRAHPDHAVERHHGDAQAERRRGRTQPARRRAAR